MPVPDVSYKVEIAFTSTWRTPAASRIWTDVSTYVELNQKIRIDYGRSDELATADANTLNLVLDNKDGRFTWGNAASPYFPNVKLGRPIRVTATTGGVDYVRFVGYINEWPVEWPGDSAGYATASVSASSRLSRLGLSAPLARTVDQAIVATGPAYYWPIAEAAGSRAALENAGSPVVLTPTSTGVQFGVGAEDSPTETLGISDERAAAKLTGSISTAVGGRLEAGFPAITANAVGAGFSVGLFVKVLNPSAPTLDAIVASVSGTGIPRGTAGTLRLDRLGPSGSGTAYPADLATASSAVHHLMFTMTRTGTPLNIALYFDGTYVGGGPFNPSGGNADIDNIRLEWPNSTTDARNVLLGRVGIWDRPLSAAEVDSIASAGLDAYQGDTTDERIKRYASWVPIATAEITTTASPVTLTGAQVEATQLETLMRQVETAENGVLYDDRNGNLVLAPRSARYQRSPALTVAFTSDLVQGYAPKVDRTGLANVGTGKGPGGSEVTYANAASRDDYGDAAYDVETTALDPDEPFQLIAWRINGNAQPRPRVPAPKFSVTDFIGGGTLGALLGLDVGQKLRLTGAPTQAPNATAADYFVEGYNEEMGPGTWDISPNLSPSAAADAVLILDSATAGLLDTNTLAL